MPRIAAPRLALPEDDKRKYDNHLRKTLGKRGISTIKRADLAELPDKLAKHSGPTLSNHVVALFNRIMNWAVDDRIAEFNPGARLRKVGESRPRERVPPEENVPGFWLALAAMETMSGEHMAPAEKGRMLSDQASNRSPKVRTSRDLVARSAVGSGPSTLTAWMM
ncbi:MAG: hypothetical protein EKK41_18145 [Hyphomicrobiales bacterium]|nr:MAG: hypothetical protein EKK41_18145 [Hyphomicrobiales bacterium]